jgi:hypothetical protein
VNSHDWVEEKGLEGVIARTRWTCSRCGSWTWYDIPPDPHMAVFLPNTVQMGYCDQVVVHDVMDS